MKAPQVTISLKMVKNWRIWGYPILGNLHAKVHDSGFLVVIVFFLQAYRIYDSWLLPMLMHQ